MKLKTYTYAFLACLALITMWAAQASIEAGSKAYPTKSTALHASKDASSETIATLKTNQGYTVVSVDGKWVQIKSSSGTGWAYKDNLSDTAASSGSEDLDLSGGQSLNGADNSAAARGFSFDKDAESYAGQSKAVTVAQLKWMMRFNASISSSEVTEFVKNGREGSAPAAPEAPAIPTTNSTVVPATNNTPLDQTNQAPPATSPAPTETAPTPAAPSTDATQTNLVKPPE